MNCPVGRTYDQSHQTCKRCPVVCKKPRKIRTAVNSGPAGENRWMTTLDLTSPNAWANKKNGRHIYRGVKQQWARALSGAAFHLSKAKSKRRVEIVRHVASQGHFFDPDNLVGSCKPLLDILVLSGILLDDNSESISLDVRQEVGTARVEIAVEAL